METTQLESDVTQAAYTHEPPGQDLVGLLTSEFERFYRRVYGYLVYRVFDRELAEELTAQTFMKAAESVHRLSGDEQYLKAWLLRTATNLAKTHWRQTQRRWSVLESFARTQSTMALADPATNAAKTQKLDRLRSALMALGPNDQAVVVLRYYVQMSFNEISEVLDCRPDAVRARLSRAIGKMRRQLNAGGKGNK